MRPGFIQFGENKGTGVPSGPKGHAFGKGRRRRKQPKDLEEVKAKLERKIARAEDWLAKLPQREAKIAARKARLDEKLPKWRQRLASIAQKLAGGA